jgi:hypothetical protein
MSRFWEITIDPHQVSVDSVSTYIISENNIFLILEFLLLCVQYLCSD